MIGVLSAFFPAHLAAMAALMRVSHSQFYGSTRLPRPLPKTTETPAPDNIVQFPLGRRAVKHRSLTQFPSLAVVVPLAPARSSRA